MTDLHLSQNRLSVKSAEMLKDALASSQNFYELELQDDTENFQVWSQIQDILTRNVKMLETEETNKGITNLLMEGEIGRLFFEKQRLFREQALQLEYEQHLRDMEKGHAEKLSLLEFHRGSIEQQKQELLTKRQTLLVEKQKLEQERARLEAALKK